MGGWYGWQQIAVWEERRGAQWTALGWVKLCASWKSARHRQAR